MGRKSSGAFPCSRHPLPQRILCLPRRLRSGKSDGVIRAAKDRATYLELTQLPNIGPATAGDLRLLGIRSPAQLVGRDPYAMYDSLCRATGQRHDPCVIDVFISAVRFMEGAPARPWWRYTAERKARLGPKPSPPTSRSPRRSPC